MHLGATSFDTLTTSIEVYWSQRYIETKKI